MRISSWRIPKKTLPDGIFQKISSEKRKRQINWWRLAWTPDSQLKTRWSKHRICQIIFKTAKKSNICLQNVAIKITENNNAVLAYYWRLSFAKIKLYGSCSFFDNVQDILARHFTFFSFLCSPWFLPKFHNLFAGS